MKGRGAVSTLALTACAIDRADAAELPFERLLGGMSIGTAEVFQIAIFAGVMGAALISAIWIIRERARIERENGDLRGRIADLSATVQRADALLHVKDQRVVVWMDDHRKPEIVGQLPPGTGVPEDRSAFLAFGKWLPARAATSFERALAELRAKGTAFELVAETQTGAPIEIHGRASAGNAVVRFVSLSEARHAHARLQSEHGELKAEIGGFRALLDTIDMPFWLRGPDGRLSWVNRAYADAVEAPSSDAAVREGRELLGTQAREGIARHHLASPVFRQTVSTVVRGDRMKFAVTETRSAGGSAGIAIDATALEAQRDEHVQMQRSHADTLDQLTTAVAIFDEGQKLRFYNQAFQKLWDLDSGFLEGRPENAILLDRLRSERKLAEQPEWRRWKEQVLSAYRAVESQEHWWHLPDARTIRVIANPSPKGGVTWIFENLTEQIRLESRYNAAVRVQGETLDNLAEGVAVFGSDGRARLFNPAFARLWGLDPASVAPDMHISTLRDACAAVADPNPWDGFVATVTGFDEERHDRHGHVELKNGMVLRHALIPLPNGQVMMTFVDVTDSVNVERALKDKNEALQRADQLKNDFVQHVSYELRSPLTNIIGFTELLALPDTGPLTTRQRDYLDHIGSSSAVLLTIVNDILDLATVDAGIMELELGDVQVAEMVDAAAALIADRLRDHAIRLSIDLSEAPKTFRADEYRVRQVLFNLLSNAANFAPEGSEIRLACRQAGADVEFAVHDDGPGMPPELLDTVFRRFEPRPNGGRRRGAGLGLSLVKGFVELHGGKVEIETGPSKGTTVTCRFPVARDDVRTAAE
jgi:signal transduction histidine kinase/PAS domain-containing protein